MLFFRRNCSRPGQTPGHSAASLFFATLSGLMLSQSALASNITIASPVNGTRVSSSIWVRAHSVGCDGLRPHAFGYSIDNSRTTVWGVTAYDIDATKVSMSAGTHTIHFKSWTSNGICPVVNTTFSTASGTTTPPPVSGLIPSDAIAFANLDSATRWAGEQDAGMPGSARGSTVYPATTPSGDDARQFYMTYSSRGGVRWHISFARDESATHFVYDTFVYLTDPSQVANIELT